MARGAGRSDADQPGDQEAGGGAGGSAATTPVTADALGSGTHVVESVTARLAGDAFLSIVGAAADGLFRFLLVLVVARALGATDSGAFFEAIAIFTITSNFVQLGADAGLVRSISHDRAVGRVGNIRPTLLISLIPVVGLATAAGVVVFLAAPVLSNLAADDPQQAILADLIRVLAPFLPVSACYAASIWATRGFGTMAPFIVVEDVLKPAARPLLMLLVLAAGLGRVGFALAWALPILGAMVAVLLWMVHLLRDTERAARAAPARPNRELAGAFWRFSAPAAIAALLATLVTRLDTLLLGALDSTRAAGVYAVASRLSKLGWLAAVAIPVAIPPVISAALARRDLRNAEVLYRAATVWMIALSWPLFLGAVVFAPVLLRAFGPDFQDGASALALMSLAWAAVMAFGPSGAVLVMGGRSGLRLANAAGSLTLNLVLDILLIPRYGVEGAAIAFAVSVVANSIATAIQIRVVLGIQPFGLGTGVVMAASVLFFGALGVGIRVALGATEWAAVLFLAVATSMYVFVLWRARRVLYFSEMQEGLRLGGRITRFRLPWTTGSR